MIRNFLAVFLCICSAATALAAPIVPSFDTFGTLPGATFGGSGIPNTDVAITAVSDGPNTITLGLTAHARALNPLFANNGAGTFYPGPGANFGDPTFVTMPSSNSGATWNFGMQINIVGGGTFADYVVELEYDFDPAANTDEADHGVLNYNDALTFNSAPLNAFSILGDTQNLNFTFLANGALPFITVPTFPAFDPNAIGEYTFSLIVSDNSNNELGRASILVDVGGSLASEFALPEPSSFLLLCGAGTLLIRRRARDTRRR